MSDVTKTKESMSTAFLGITHLVVESATFYSAVAKGGTAANPPHRQWGGPTVDDYALIYDLNEASARQLAKQGPHFPDAVQVSSEEGEQLLRAARDRIRIRARRHRSVRRNL